eukprot:6235873-Pyramimonas_sp.AAC.1
MSHLFEPHDAGDGLVAHTGWLEEEYPVPEDGWARCEHPTLSSWGLGPRGHAVVLPRQSMVWLAQLVSSLALSWGRSLGCPLPTVVLPTLLRLLCSTPQWKNLIRVGSVIMTRRAQRHCHRPSG